MINSFFKSKTFLPSIQFIALLVFIGLINGAIGISTDDPNFAKELRNTNLSNLIVWSYWWPLIIASAILFGRYWCSICPVELITLFFGKIGLRKKPGKWLKSGWIITLFYALILILGIHTMAIHRIPQLMAVYMLILFGLALVVGLYWEKRTFCTYVCPIGHLLGFYSLLSFTKLRVKEPEVCRSCKTKDCISKDNHYKFTGRSCTSELYPAKLKDNKDCILCGQCFKSCTHDNIAIQKQRFARDLFANIKLKWAEIAFFIMLSSFVVYEILSEWKVSKRLVMGIPNWLNQSLELSGNITGTVKAVSLFVVLPMSFYFFMVLAKRLLAKETWKSGFTQLVLAILPITASMHLLKALLKTTSRIPYWQYVFTDPTGIDTAMQILENPDLLQNALLSNIISPVLNVIAVILPFVGLILSFYVIRKQTYRNTISIGITLLAVILYSGVFIVSLIGWKVM